MANLNGKRISKEEMDKMRDNYKSKTNFETESVYFDRATFERLLATPGTVGVRVYYGVNDEGQLHPIFVPVAEGDMNIYFDKGASTIEEYGTACPPFCPPKQ